MSRRLACLEHLDDAHGRAAARAGLKGHGRLGKALTNAVSSYNKTIGSLEGRVLVSARKLNQLGVVDGELNAPTPVEETVRALSAADLIPDPEPELVAGPGAARADPTAPQLVGGPRAMGAAS